MKSIKKFWRKAIAFVTLTGFLLSYINNVLLIKGSELKLWTCVSTYSGYYGLEKDSLDALILGTSHAFYNLIPQRLYDEYGIRSFNIGTPNQNTLDSYYVLKEALKYQTPKIVVFEAYGAIFDHYADYNEIAHWKALGYMRWSMNKVEAIHAACETIKDVDPIAFYLPNIRFHGNWKGLKMNDFAYGYYQKRTESKGYYPATWRCNDSYKPYETDDSVPPRIFQDIAIEYLDKIIDLCQENQIQLMVIKTPFTLWEMQESNGMHAFAKERGIPFYDLNLVKNYEQLNFNYGNDIAGTGHCNIRGAIKCTDYLGKILTEDFNIHGQPDEQWENTRSFSDKIVSIQNVASADNIDKYLEYIDNPLYTVFFSIKVDGMEGMSKKTRDKMKKLGLFQNGEPGTYQEYVAVIDHGNLEYEQIGGVPCSRTGILSNGKIRYKLESSTSWDPGASKITIYDITGDIDYSMDRKGFNIVVYDRDDMSVIDSCSYDPANRNKAIEHKYLGY